MLTGEMGIDLGSRDVGMPQKLLKLSQIHFPAMEQVSGYAMADGMRSNFGFYP